MSKILRLPFNFPKPSLDAQFEEFWKVFPKQVGKQQAWAKWRQITSEEGMDTRALCKDSGEYLWIHVQATPERIIAGARRYRKNQTDPQTYRVKDFTCMPVTWLNNGRWEDDE